MAIHRTNDRARAKERGKKAKEAKEDILRPRPPREDSKEARIKGAAREDTAQ